MRILVVGAGAVGGYFGARLAQAGRDVTFLVRPKRAAELKEKGLRVVSPHGDLTLSPKVVTAREIATAFDVVLISVKSYALADAINDFAPSVGPDTLIVPTLNGMRHIDILIERFGKHNVLGGVCMVSAVIDDQGRIQQLTGTQSLTYGELDGRITPRLERLHETIAGAGFDAKMSDRILADMWEKWVRLATLGALNCLLRGDIGEIASVSGGPAIASAMVRECSKIATACGYPNAGVAVEQQYSQITPDSRLTASMYRDMMAGGPVEADTILGDLLERGRRHGVAAPLLEAAFVNLAIYELRRERERNPGAVGENTGSNASGKSASV